MRCRKEGEGRGGPGPQRSLSANQKSHCSLGGVEGPHHGLGGCGWSSTLNKTNAVPYITDDFVACTKTFQFGTVSPSDLPPEHSGFVATAFKGFHWCCRCCGQACPVF